MTARLCLAGMGLGLALLCETDARAANPAETLSNAQPKWFGAVMEQVRRIPAAPPPALPMIAATSAANPRVFPRWGFSLDPSGVLGTFRPAGSLLTSTNAFFQTLGTNGRTCSSCHRTNNGFGLATSTLQNLYRYGGDSDPVFAAVDGADCPSEPHSHSLLLTRGLIRIFLPVPATADYTLKVVHDPNGCNTLPAYATTIDAQTGETLRMVSIYRRPRPTTDLPLVLSTNGLKVDPLTGIALPMDPYTGELESGNILWDGREPTLQSQALHATLGHAQAAVAPTAAQLAQIVSFERSVFSGQSFDFCAGLLDAEGATGGPAGLASEQSKPGEDVAFSLYDSWSALSAHGWPDQRRRSIARGEIIFNTRKFLIRNVAGLNNAPGLANPLSGSCSTCHNANHAGADGFPAAQRAIGVDGDQEGVFAPAPSADLPIFEITCNPGAPTAFGVTKFMTNDPGKALISGKCSDVGRMTVPPLRGLASRAPYFSNGAAQTLGDVVRFYDTRFSMGLSRQDEDDLVNFLAAL